MVIDELWPKLLLILNEHQIYDKYNLQSTVYEYCIEREPVAPGRIYRKNSAIGIVLTLKETLLIGLIKSSQIQI